MPVHPNVLPVVEVMEDEGHYYAVLPYCNGGELFAHIEATGAMSPEHAHFYFKQIISGRFLELPVA